MITDRVQDVVYINLSWEMFLTVYICLHWIMLFTLILFNWTQTVLCRITWNMSKCLSLCDYNGSGLTAQSLPVRVIGRCAEGKHYLRSVEPVKCSLCVCCRGECWVQCVYCVFSSVCVCWLMVVQSDFKLWLSYLNCLDHAHGHFLSVVVVFGNWMSTNQQLVYISLKREQIFHMFECSVYLLCISI